MATSQLPAHARPSHAIRTPRLLIRSTVVSDALAVTFIRTDKLNNPFGGVVESGITLVEQQERIAGNIITTAEGKNAWMVAIIRDPNYLGHGIKELGVEEGIVIGNTGFNSFPSQPSIVDPLKEVIVGDIGCLIDHRFVRKGYAVETLSAVIEYGLGELRCGMISLATNFDNEPFRNVMRTMGIGEGTIVVEGEDRTVKYLFDRTMWERAREHMKASGKWYL
jgi:RimJ/RimL family protein N-acetyltransferase